MIIRTVNRNKDIHKGALGIAAKFKQLNVSIKKSLSVHKLRQLIDILGDDAKEFFNIEDYNYRIHFYREDVDNLPTGAIAVYDTPSLEGFEKLTVKRLSGEEKIKFRRMQKEVVDI